MSRNSYPYHYRSSFWDVAPIIGIVVGALAIIVGAVWFNAAWNQHHPMTCTVESKQATADKNGGHSYLLFTKECGQLQVADSWLQGKFNSTDTYARIKEGQSYYFDTVGWRNGFFSAYPNVLDAHE